MQLVDLDRFVISMDLKILCSIDNYWQHFNFDSKPKRRVIWFRKTYSPREHAIADPTIPPPDMITS